MENSQIRLKVKQIQTMLHVLGTLVVLLFVCLSPESVMAGDLDAVVLTVDGGVLQGEVVEYVPDEFITIVLATGESRTILADQIREVILGSASPEPAPTETSPVDVLPTPELPTHTPSPPNEPVDAKPPSVIASEVGPSQLSQLQLQIEGLQELRRTNGGPTALMVVGTAAFLGGLVYSSVVRSQCDDSETQASYRSCTSGAFPAVVGLAVASLASVSAGLVWSNGNRRHNRRIDEQVRALRQQLRVSVSPVFVVSGPGNRFNGVEIGLRF